MSELQSRSEWWECVGVGDNVEVEPEEVVSLLVWG